MFNNIFNLNRAIVTTMLKASKEVFLN